MVHPTVRRCLFWAHLVAGVVAGLVIFVLALTGILMSFETQIVGKAERAIVASKPTQGAELAKPSKLIAGYEKVGAEARATSLNLSSDPADPVIFQAGREGRLLLHPVSGEALGKGAEGTRRFFQVALSLHRWLTWPAPRAQQGQRQQAGGEGGGKQEEKLTWRTVGGNLTAASTLVFGFLLVSGLILWVPRKFNKKAFKAVLTVQSRLKGRARDWNWHNISGFWTAPFLLIIILTGLIMAYPWANKLMFATVGEKPPVRQNQGGERAPAARPEAGQGNREGAERNRERRGEQAETGAGGEARERRRRERPEGESGEGGRRRAAIAIKNLDAAVEVAKQAVPGWQTLSVELATDDTKPVVASVTDAGRGRPDRWVKLTIDRESLAITEREGFEKKTTGAQMRQIVRWLHTGEFGGVFGQVIAALTSAATIVLCYTGFALAWRRLAGMIKKRKAKATA